jgi:sulfatase maturation enzyme AslB (radical SAM superfamily)
MIISINPTYYCNFRCDFCYLTEQQLSDPSKLSLVDLDARIKEIKKYFEIPMVDLYGGEIGLLPDAYVNDLCILLENNGINDINIITNLSMINDVIRNPNFYVTVSYDFDCREQHDRVWNNMLQLTKEFSILILASPGILAKDVNEMILQLNLLDHLTSVEIKPYSTNQANCHSVTNIEFEEHVKKWISSPISKNFLFVNEDNITKSIDGTRNAFSNDHIYITPEGKFAVLEFDLNDNEYFKSLDNIEDYIKWADNEPELNISQICRECDYYGTCLTEHYRYVKTLDNGCNGYKGLLDWYKNERMEN